LAYEEVGKVQNKEVNLSLHRILDAKKLDYFSSNFEDIQPSCARDFNFGYRIRVETSPINISSLEVISGRGVFGDVLKLIDGKKVLFLIDVSGSMSEDGGTYCGRKVNKIQCAALFLGGITLDSLNLCYDVGFINLMSDDSEVSVYRYGFGSCQVERILDLKKLDGTTERENIKSIIKPKLGALDSTPIDKALKEAFDYAKNENIEAVVLLTDGCETCGGEIPPVHIAEKYKNEGIPIYTIGFGEYACPSDLQKIASITNGKYFDARTCEELLAITGEKIPLEITPKSWEFGDKKFSKKDALKGTITVSIPVVIFINQTTFLPGKMEIEIVSGELEEIRGFIDRSCLTEVDSQNSFSIHYPISLEVKNFKNFLCMNIEGEKVCQRISCEKTIKFKGITSPGKYTFSTINKGNVLEVKV
jgi:hypothetical protein